MVGVRGLVGQQARDRVMMCCIRREYVIDEALSFVLITVFQAEGVGVVQFVDRRSCGGQGIQKRK